MITRERGTVIVISAPSGAGKSTIIRRLKEELDNIVFSVSYTTRPKRQGEINGVDYYFVSEDVFKRMVERGEFLEYAKVYGHYYGTPLKQVLDAIEAGKDVILDLDHQGARAVRNALPDAVLVFIFPPSIEALRERLKQRKTDSEEVIETRLRNAMMEIEASTEYDYWVLNDDIEKALNEVKAIVIAERCRRTNYRWRT